LDEIVLQKKLPVLFNEKNEIINYTVNKNILYVPRLINKMTLRLGKEKVFIEKKKSESAVQE
jgi:type IV secretion system protein VirB9